MGIHLTLRAPWVRAPIFTRTLAPSRPHDLRVLALLLLIMLLAAVDLRFTLFAFDAGLLKEMNPLAEIFLRLGSVDSLVAYKLMMTTCGCIMLWKLRSARFALAGCWMLIIIHALLAILWYAWVREVIFELDLRNRLGTYPSLRFTTAQLRAAADHRLPEIAEYPRGDSKAQELASAVSAPQEHGIPPK